MERTREALEITLPGGPVVVLAEITPTQFLHACKLGGSDPSAIVRGFRTTAEAMRQAVVRVDGTAKSYADLAGPGLDKAIPHARWYNALARYFGQLHVPTEAEVAELKGAMACTVDATGERWTVPLPGGPVVVMVEVPRETVADSLREAMESGKSESAQAFVSMISGPRRAIREVDGAAVTAADLAGEGWDARFGVKATHLLGTAFAVIHGEGEDQGEAKPVSLGSGTASPTPPDTGTSR